MTQPIPLVVPPGVKASLGRAFQIGGTNVYVGPRDALPNDRHLRMPPVLAFARPGDTTPRIVTTFPNSAAAEQFIAAMIVGIEEAAGTPLQPTEAEAGA